MEPTTKLTIEVAMSETMQKQMETILETRGNRPIEQLMQQIVERGMYTLAYRTERNREVYAAQAADRALFKEFKASLKK